ncbi:class I SAM-dependent methyltransferase [Methylobacterium sp. Leaf113]|uniref:class I SAM-dependent methyltransferase n=1 Tax=Methylobacterium sp. Leaf113 TaxID=1736259 RepID=UPI0009E78F6E|nr:class I SAM-dependent methyltransferase [Methylobacterium sp. Leaf113]
MAASDKSSGTHPTYPAYAPRLAFFTMCRNEASILGPFIDQVSEFFDIGVIVDHSSTDRSTSLIKENLPSKFDLHYLKARGYPQAELATFYTKRIFDTTDADWLFFLDCDEFLPFSNRRQLNEALSDIGSADIATLQWKNIVPVNLDGANIFGGEFEEAAALSKYPKIAVSRSFYERDPQLIVTQGCHHVNSTKQPKVTELSDKGLYHIPVQSKLRFSVKIKFSADKLIRERKLLSQGLGSHWIDYKNLIAQQGAAGFDFKSAALSYPDGFMNTDDKSRPLNFKFDYIRSAWIENYDAIISDLYQSELPGELSTNFVVYDESGVIFTASDPSISEFKKIAGDVEDGSPHITGKSDRLSTLFGETYSDLVEPLFSLPMKLPVTAWAGHIPFLFVLFRMLRPRSYVDLGVHNGASLIAAATASKAYDVNTELFGVDTWQGDPHAGFYEGDQIYNELSEFTSRQFGKKVRLVRKYFDDAVGLFAPGSIDLLHIDGLHTYEAVKHDFLTWLPKVSPDGVIMFHDTAVHERGFGVFRLFKELQSEFTTIEFFQSHGLGIIFMDPNCQKLKQIQNLIRNPDAMAFYQALVSDVASLLRGRMEHLTEIKSVAHLHATKDHYQLLASKNSERASILERELRYSRLATQALQLEAAHVKDTKYVGLR